MPAPATVCFTVDVEPDCPPFLTGFRGVEQGMPRLLAMLAEERVPATFFTTGDVGQRYPGVVSAMLAEGHELACHGMTHRSFATMSDAEASAEIAESARILRRHSEVTSFRAPYLEFPERFLPLLEANGFAADSSGAKYKGRGRWAEGGGPTHSTAESPRPRAHSREPIAHSPQPIAHSREPIAESPPAALSRFPASVTSSVLRLPRVVREGYLRALSSPVVLFVHPWEFVDLRRERLRIDCRFRTGGIALDCVRDVIRSFARRGARFTTVRDLAARRAA